MGFGKRKQAPKFFRLRFNGRYNNSEIGEVKIEREKTYTLLSRKEITQAFKLEKNSPLYLGVKNGFFSFFTCKNCGQVNGYYKAKNSRRHFYLIPPGVMVFYFPNIDDKNSPKRWQPEFVGT